MEISTHNTIRNALYNFTSYVWLMIFSIIITPIIVFKLGVRDYGIYVFVNTLLSLIGLIDLGIGISTLKHTAEYIATKQEHKLKELLYSMNSIYLIMGLVGLMVFLILGLMADSFFANKLIGESQSFLIFLAAGLIFFTSIFTSIYGLSLNALQRYDIGTKISIIFVTISNLGTLIIASLNYKLVPIFFFQLLINIISTITLVIISRKIFPILKFKFLFVKNEIIKSYKYGLSVFLTNIAGSSLTYLDRLIIPFFLGPSNLTYYSLPGNITNKIPGISNNLSGVLFPVTVSLHSTNSMDRLRQLYIRSFRLLTILSASISISIIFMADKILFYWLNEDFSNRATQVLIILTITSFILALQGPLTSFLLALGKMKFLSTLSVLMALLNAILLIILLPKYGIVGAAWAYLISILPVIYMFYYTEKHYLDINIRIKHIKLYLQIFITSIPFIIIERVLIYPQIKDVSTLIFYGPLAVLIFLVLYYLFNFYEHEDLSDFKKFIVNITDKFKR